MSPTVNAELRTQYGAFNTAMRTLYKDDILQLASKKKTFEFDDSLFEAAASLVYENGGFDISQLEDPAARAVINETLRVLSTAIDSGLPHEVPATVRYALENNAFIFSGFKTFHSMREIGLSMVTDKGEIKSFNDFMTEVKKINQKYNHNYLYAEYNHAVGTSLMAAKWHDFEQDGDRYDLQYRTANDGKVREEHALLHETTLPASDPFWDKYFPPNGWNCRCTVVQVRKGKYPTSDPAMAMLRGDNCTDGVKQRMFRYNPGKTMELFPPKHPYRKAPKATKAVIEKVSAEEMRAKRIQDIIAELPDTLTQSEKQAIAENCLEIEQNYGIVKGKSMTYEQANTGKENPHYKQGGGYHINCQTCTVTHWLRRLGFNLQAQPNKVLHKRHQGTAYDILDKVGIKWTERFVNLDGSKIDYDFTYKWQIKKGYKSMTTQRLHEYLNEKLANDGVYEIYCGWKGGDAHVFCAEVSDGKVRYFDPQSGDNDVSRYIPRMKPGMVGVIRIDNKKINPDIGKLFLNAE